MQSLKLKLTDFKKIKQQPDKWINAQWEDPEMSEKIMEQEWKKSICWINSVQGDDIRTRGAQDMQAFS